MDDDDSLNRTPGPGPSVLDVLNDLIGVYLLARANLHIDERSLPEAVLDDRRLAVLDDQLMTAGMDMHIVHHLIQTVAQCLEHTDFDFEMG